MSTSNTNHLSDWDILNEEEPEQLFISGLDEEKLVTLLGEVRKIVHVHFPDAVVGIVPKLEHHPNKSNDWTPMEVYLALELIDGKDLVNKKSISQEQIYYGKEGTIYYIAFALLDGIGRYLTENNLPFKSNWIRKLAWSQTIP